MFKAIVEFADLQDAKHLYHVGDEFPHDGVKVSQKRIDELKSNNNMARKPLIEEVAEEKKTTAPKKGKKADDTNDSL